MNISQTGLGERTLNALLGAGIETAEELNSMPMRELTQLRGFGFKAKADVERFLKKFRDGQFSHAPHPANSLEDILRMGSRLEGRAYAYLKNSLLSNSSHHRETQWQFGMPLSFQSGKTKDIIQYIFDKK